MAGLGSTLREEYQFYKMMDSLNVRLAANDKRRPDNPIGLFTVHQVVLLHDKLDELLRQRGDGLGAHMTSNPPRGGRKIDKTFRDALRQTFMECNGINKMRLSDATLDGLIEAWTDAGEEFGKYMTNEARGGDRQDFGQVPISPFDPRFRELSAVKHAGFQPLFGGEVLRLSKQLTRSTCTFHDTGSADIYTIVLLGDVSTRYAPAGRCGSYSGILQVAPIISLSLGKPLSLSRFLSSGL